MTTTAITKPTNGAVDAPTAPRPTLIINDKGVVALRTLDDVQRFARVAVMSGFYPTSGGNPDVQLAQATMKILYGMRLGLDAMQALQGIYVIEGKISLSAALIAARIEEHPRVAFKTTKFANDGAVIEWFVDKERVGESSFSIDDAKRAGLAGGSKKNWNGYPKSMCWARALTQGARVYATVVFNGSVYTPEEMGAENDDVVEFDRNGKPIEGSRAQVNGPGLGGSDALHKVASAGKQQPIVDAEVTPAAAATTSQEGTPLEGESVVVREPGSESPDDVPVVATPEVLEPVQGAELSAALRTAMNDTPRDGATNTMMKHIGTWAEKLSKDEAEMLRVWARHLYNTARKKPEDEGFDDVKKATLARLKALVPATQTQA
jgi:hypothetical protein